MGERLDHPEIREWCLEWEVDTNDWTVQALERLLRDVADEVYDRGMNMILQDAIRAALAKQKEQDDG